MEPGAFRGFSYKSYLRALCKSYFVHSPSPPIEANRLGDVHCPSLNPFRRHVPFRNSIYDYLILILSSLDLVVTPPSLPSLSRSPSSVLGAPSTKARLFRLTSVDLGGDGIRTTVRLLETERTQRIRRDWRETDKKEDSPERRADFGRGETKGDDHLLALDFSLSWRSR
jgi:hypothetical protein